MSKSRSTKEPTKEEMYKDLPVTRRESDTGRTSDDSQEGEEDDHAEDKERNWDRPTDRMGKNGDHRKGDADPEPPEDRPVPHSDRVYADPRNDQRGYGQGAGSHENVTDKAARAVEGKKLGTSKTTSSLSENDNGPTNEGVDDLGLLSSSLERKERGPNSFMRNDPFSKDPDSVTKTEPGTISNPPK